MSETLSEKEIRNAQHEAALAEIEAFNSTNRFYRKLDTMFTDRRRDIEHECGYPRTDEIVPEKYKYLYDREPIAAKVVDLYPRYCWQRPPRVYETEDINDETPFELAWKTVGQQLKGGSFFKDQDSLGDPILDCLERADKLSGVGHYGVILLGLDDGRDMLRPVELNEEGSPEVTRELTYLRTVDESQAQIASVNMDRNSPRYGHAETYSISVNNPTFDRQSAKEHTTDTIQVHWTRVIHLVDSPQCGPLYGVPRMLKVFNRLYDLHKLYGGSAEMYWLGAFPGLSFETHPSLGGNVSIDESSAKKQIENYQHGLQRWLSLPGISAKSLAPQVVDPSPHIDKQLESIAVYLEVPKRILMGSERGELSSGQDARDWYGRKIPHRNHSYVIPRVIVPFVDRLIKIGVLPRPEEGYYVKYPDTSVATDTERATVASRRTDAMVKYVSGNVKRLIAPKDYLVRIIGFSKEEAQEILEARKEAESNEDLDLLEPEVDPNKQFEQNGFGNPGNVPSGQPKENRNPKGVDEPSPRTQKV